MSSRVLFLGVMTSFAAACGNVAATGDAGGGGDAAARSVTCDATSHTVSVLPNASFDASTPPWIQDPVTPSLLCGAPRITPADGPTAACLGATDGVTQTMTQSIALPANLQSLTLSGQICIDTAETVAIDHDILQFDVLDGAVTLAALGKQTNQQGKSGCQFAAFALPAATASADPATATFRIRATLDTDKPTSFYVDKLSLVAACKL